MTLPFPISHVLYRFATTEEEQRRSGWTMTEVVVRDDLRIFGLYAERWLEADARNLVIARLLSERTDLIQQRDSEWDRRKQATAARQQVEAERDEMRLEIATLKAERERYLSHAK